MILSRLNLKSSKSLGFLRLIQQIEHRRQIKMSVVLHEDVPARSTAIIITKYRLLDFFLRCKNALSNVPAGGLEHENNICRNCSFHLVSYCQRTSWKGHLYNPVIIQSWLTKERATMARLIDTRWKFSKNSRTSIIFSDWSLFFCSIARNGDLILFAS